MLIFMTVMAILGWLQAIRISHKFDRLVRVAALEIDAAQRQNVLLQHQLSEASKWSNHE
jgi:hypothetical protein